MIANYNMIIDFARPQKSNTIVVMENDAETRNCNFKLLFDKQDFDMTGVVSAVVKGVTQSGSTIWDTATIKEDTQGNYINELSYLIPLAVTENVGNVTMTITLEGENHETITSFEFYIKARNILYNEDDVISEDDMDGFRDLLVRSQAALARMEELVQNNELPNPYPIRFTLDGVEYEYKGDAIQIIELDDVAYLGDAVGSVEVTEDDSAAEVAVQAAESAQASSEHVDELYTEISNIVNEFESLIPTATVVKDGHTSTITITDQSGVSVAEVDDGATGATPNITAVATVDEHVGTPSVTVTKTGTDENPTLTFAFANLKGEKGDTGSGANVDWGDVHGTLSDQTDLQTALNAKYDTADTAESTIADDDYFPFYDTSASSKRKTLWSTISAKIKALVNPVRITLNKAAYDALSTSEKNDPDKVYYVNDYDEQKTYVKLDDSTTALDKIWSSKKTSDELAVVAASNTLGRVKVGSNMSISDAVINPANIEYGTSALTSGTSSLATGKIYCQYE